MLLTVPPKAGARLPTLTVSGPGPSPVSTVVSVLDFVSRMLSVSPPVPRRMVRSSTSLYSIPRLASPSTSPSPVSRFDVSRPVFAKAS